MNLGSLQYLKVVVTVIGKLEDGIKAVQLQAKANDNYMYKKHS